MSQKPQQPRSRVITRSSRSTAGKPGSLGQIGSISPTRRHILHTQPPLPKIHESMIATWQSRQWNLTRARMLVRTLFPKRAACVQMRGWWPDLCASSPTPLPASLTVVVVMAPYPIWPIGVDPTQRADRQSKPLELHVHLRSTGTYLLIV